MCRSRSVLSPCSRARASERLGKGLGVWGFGGLGGLGGFGGLGVRGLGGLGFEGLRV